MAADWCREIVTVESVTTEVVTTESFQNMAFGPIGRCVGMSCRVLTSSVGHFVDDDVRGARALGFPLVGWDAHVGHPQELNHVCC